MYRMLIVDDEAIIADGLCEVFQNMDDMELDVYKAYSGDEALEILDITRMDIILTDIRMPEIDGLQLLEKIREKWPKCRVVFLTGYNEFEYIYTAIKYDGVDYLLKTEGYDEVIRVVKNVVADIETSLKTQELISKAQEQLNKTLQLLQKDYFNGVLKGEISVHEINQQQFNELEIPLRADFPVLILLGSIDDDLFVNQSYSEKSKQLYSIRLIAEQYFSSHVSCVYTTNGSAGLVWLIQPEERKIGVKDNDELWTEVLTFVRENLELVHAACKETLGISISFVLDDSPTWWGEILQRFSVLKMLLNYRIGQGCGIQLTSKSILESEFPQLLTEGLVHQYILQSKLENMRNFLEHGDKDAFEEIFEQLAAQLKQIKNMDYVPAQNLYYSLAMVFFSYMIQWNLADKVSLKVNLDKLMQVKQFETFNEAVAYLRSLRDILFDIQGIEQEKRAQNVIMKLKKYINGNIHNQDRISLAQLANHVHFNPSYLSRLFKQVTGTNLSGYICDMKIQKAKELLQDPNMKVYEVAQALGYSSAANFVRFFRRIMHMSPQEYKIFLANKSIDESKVNE